MTGISRQTDYAARIVIHLACLDEGARVPIAEIAERRLLPAPFVRRVIGRLVKAGIIRTLRGANGGVALARPAAQISLLDVVDAMEGGVVLNRCVDTPSACPLARACPVNAAWSDATRALETSLAAIRFDQLATGTEGHVSAHGYGSARRSAAQPAPKTRSPRRAASGGRKAAARS
jgi:Rrf2 family protein